MCSRPCKHQQASCAPSSYFPSQQPGRLCSHLIEHQPATAALRSQQHIGAAVECGQACAAQPQDVARVRVRCSQPATACTCGWVGRWCNCSAWLAWHGIREHPAGFWRPLHGTAGSPPGFWKQISEECLEGACQLQCTRYEWGSLHCVSPEIWRGHLSMAGRQALLRCTTASQAEHLVLNSNTLHWSACNRAPSHASGWYA
jgi:hypothetical protein